MTCPDCGTVNPSGMRFCGMCGSAIGPQLAGRERRRVSTVFVDLASFSTMTRGLDPEDVRDLADEVLTVVAGIIENFDGYVDAFRGDGLIALFGAPHAHADDPERAVRAAAAALAAIEAVGRQRGTPLRGRAGVTTGTVIAGSIGSGRVRDYTVMGSSVNLAARIEEAAADGEVWVGPETWELTRHAMAYERTATLHLNGFPNIREAYRLVDEYAAQAIDPFADVPFVGRSAELAALRALLDETLATGRTHRAAVVGDTGSGKSRLLREFADRIADDAEVVWLTMQPTEPFRWHLLARPLFGLRDGEERSVLTRQVRDRLELLIPDNSRWQEIVLESLGLTSPRSWTRLERRRVDRTLIAWRDVLAAYARANGRPLALLVEDDALDPTLNELWVLLSDADAPILAIRTTRSEPRAGDATAIPMPPLTTAESRTLLEHVASPELQVAANALVAQVGGVPASVLELGRALSLTGERSVAGSLTNLLQARLDLVSPAARRLLAEAAVVGERSWGGLLEALAPGDADATVRTLTGPSLLVQQASSSLPGESEYRFHSELLRRAALRTIPFSDQPIVHLKVATWLEAHAPLSFSAAIAEHFHRGGSDDAALGHYLAAAELARSEGDFEACAKLFDAVAGLSIPPEDAARSALASAEAALEAQDEARARRQLERARTLIDTLPDDAVGSLRATLGALQRDLDATRGPTGANLTG